MKKLFAVLTIFLCLAANAGVLAQTGSENGSAAAVTGKEIVKSAMKYIGTPYRSGRMNPKHGFDCSGFTTFIFKQKNIELPRVSRLQYQKSTAISDCKELRKGDLVFFSGSRVSKRIGHVGIVTDVNHETGEFSFIHASCSEGVTVSSSTEAYYAKRYIGACRILPSLES